MKHFSEHFVHAVSKLIEKVFPPTVEALTQANGGVDCIVFDDEHRQAWHDLGFSDAEVEALCIAVGCCQNRD